jgi:hypothetical protein
VSKRAQRTTRRALRSSKPKEIFLSHSGKDRHFAKALAMELRSHGLKVWYSATHIVGAQQWHDEIGKALRRCDWFVLVLSKNAIKSPWVKRELLFALSDRRYENRIVPIVYKPCDPSQLSWTLPSFQMVDFQNHVRGYKQLFRAWNMRYQRS